MENQAGQINMEQVYVGPTRWDWLNKILWRPSVRWFVIETTKRGPNQALGAFWWGIGALLAFKMFKVFGWL